MVEIWRIEMNIFKTFIGFIPYVDKIMSWDARKLLIQNTMRLKVKGPGWMTVPEEFKNIEHGYSLVSDYYIHRHVDGVDYYKITLKGKGKIIGRSMNKETHNWLVYLSGGFGELYDVSD